MKLRQPGSYANGLTIELGASLLVGRDGGGLYCLTSICTGDGCDLAGGSGLLESTCGAVNNEIRCTCHGDLFGATGAVINGPATLPLKAYALALGCDGFVYADLATTVASTVRLSV